MCDLSMEKGGVDLAEGVKQDGRYEGAKRCGRERAVEDIKRS